MKLKKFGQFSEENKFKLAINEGIFDKIGSLVKGKSDKGAIVSKFLKANGIKEKGTAYDFTYGGGYRSDISNPWGYLSQTPGVAGVKDGKLVLIDEKYKKIKVPDTITWNKSLLDKLGMDKANTDVYSRTDPSHHWPLSEKEANFMHYARPGKNVSKMDYEFDLYIDPPVFITKTCIWDIPSQKWEIHREKEEQEIDDRFSLEMEDEREFFSVLTNTPMKEITLGEWVNKFNGTGIDLSEDWFMYWLGLSEYENGIGMNLNL